jgi:HJR/Mrr/RecB family endonuclease
MRNFKLTSEVLIPLVLAVLGHFARDARVTVAAVIGIILFPLTLIGIIVVITIVLGIAFGAKPVSEEYWKLNEPQMLHGAIVAWGEKLLLKGEVFNVNQEADNLLGHLFPRLSRSIFYPAKLQSFRAIIRSNFEKINSTMSAQQSLAAQTEYEIRQLRAEEHEKQLLKDMLIPHSKLTENFLRVAYEATLQIDEYGDFNGEAFDRELMRFLAKLEKKDPALGINMREIKKRRMRGYQLDSKMALIIQDLKDQFAAYQRSRAMSRATEPVPNQVKMSGIEFERWICDSIRSFGASEARLTKATGDQGADILFEHLGLRVAVQAKSWSGSVGNKAVQEAHSAKSFYDCHAAWVMTPSTFTASARTLAHRLNVLLIDGSTLNDFKGAFDQYFTSMRGLKNGSR